MHSQLIHLFEYSEYVKIVTAIQALSARFLGEIKHPGVYIILDVYTYNNIGVYGVVTEV